LKNRKRKIETRHRGADAALRTEEDSLETLRSSSAQPRPALYAASEETGDPPVEEPAPVRRDTSSRLAGVIRRQWLVVLTATAAVMLLAWLFTVTQPKLYRATAIAAVTPLTAELTDTDVLRGIEGLDRRVVVATVAALAMTPETLRGTGSAGYSIRAAVLPNTNLFRIEVDGRSASEAAEIANQIPTLLAAQTRAMYRLYGVALISEATPPQKAFAPRVGRAAVAGVLLGLVAGIAIAFFVDDRRWAH
jgi:capsular polysaccharide biosynthesis protein